MTRALVLAAVLAGCGDPADIQDADPGLYDSPSYAPDAEPCGALDGDPAWLPAMLSATVAELAATARSTAAQRDATRDYLIAALAAQGIVATEDSYGMGANVVARLPGATDAWLVLGAHFDTVANSPGANDNATGVATVLAAARLLRDTCRQRGVIIAFFDQEELGLIGAEYLSAELLDEDIVAVHTIDQVGWDADNDRRFELELPGAGLAAQYQTAAAALGLATSTTTTAGSDHSAFRADGFPAIGLTEEYAGGDTTPHYHLATDTFATVELGFTADAVRLVSRVLAVAAQ